MDTAMVDLNASEIKSEVLNLIPRMTALKMCVLPLELADDCLTVASAEGSQRDVEADLQFLLGKKIRIQKVPEEVLRAAICRYYSAAPMEVSHPNTGTSELFLQHTNKEEGGRSDGSAITTANRIITDAIELGASDIHLEPYEADCRVRYRLDGVLHNVLHLPLVQAKSIASRLKIMANLDIAERRRPQDGRLRVHQHNRDIDLRVSTLPTNFGEKVVLRILDKSRLQLDLSKLGFETEDLRRFQRTIRLPYRMILVTGPTGSGKTTTLYAALESINRPEANITTIEDPIEYNLPGINQTHVRPEIGLTFAAVLRSILRQDPNVIMVGEIRDAETAEIAIRAAMTGHLVFSTIHTNDAPSAITRLIDLGVEPFLIGSSVKMIIAQRLLRKICPACSRAEAPTSGQIQELGEGSLKKMKYFKSTGCGVCKNFGYSGRTAVYEVLEVNNGIADLIVRGATVSDVRQRMCSEGRLTLRQAALLKAERGETSLDEVIRETVF